MGFDNHMWGGLGGGNFGLFSPNGLITLVLVIVWVAILVDCARRDFENVWEKIFWIIAMIVAPVVGSVAYLAVIKFSNPRGILKHIQNAMGQSPNLSTPPAPPAPPAGVGPMTPPPTGPSSTNNNPPTPPIAS